MLEQWHLNFFCESTGLYLSKNAVHLPFKKRSKEFFGITVGSTIYIRKTRGWFWRGNNLKCNIKATQYIHCMLMQWLQSEPIEAVRVTSKDYVIPWWRATSHRTLYSPAVFAGCHSRGRRDSSHFIEHKVPQTLMTNWYTLGGEIRGSTASTDFMSGICSAIT